MHGSTSLNDSLPPKACFCGTHITGLALSGLLVQDPTAPPFTQLAPKYNIFYDGNGTAWHHDINGQWVPAPREAPIPPPQTPLRPSFELRGAPTTAQHAPPQSTTYGFPATPSAQPVPPHLIDPRLLPLPRSDDRDLSDPYTIAKASLRPATKVGSVRQKDKGKKRQLPSDSSDDSDNAGPVPKRGRPQGSSNYNKEDTKVVLKIIEKVLPIGSKGWGVVALRFNKYAVKNNRPERDVKSIETKYKQLLRKKKPTGDGDCPPDVKRAHRIEGLINQKADTRDLSDSEFDDAGAAGASDSSDDDVVEVVPSTTIRTAVARRAPSPPLRRASSPTTRRPRINAPELVNQLSKAFDPKVAKAREDERANRSFQTTHMFTLSQQLRDAQTTNDNLRSQITVMQGRIHVAERVREVAELKLELFQTGTGPFGRRNRAAVYARNPDLVRVNGKVRYPSSDDDADKENKDPGSPSRSRRSSSHDDINRGDCFTLHDDDTLIDYSSLHSTSSSAANVGDSSSASVVDSMPVCLGTPEV